jgi:two-component system, response regulator PdtaR
MNGLRWELARPTRQELECAVLDRVGIPGTLRGARADRCSYFKGFSLNCVGRCASPSKILYSLCDLIGAVCATAEGRMPAILIVEDDVLANEHLEYILQQAGYEVLSATSADDALELLEDGADVRLIVTDINLPGTRNGLKLAAVAKAQRPEINFIIVKGYNAFKKDEIPPGSLFIPKPYDARKMMEAIRHFQRAA